MPNKKAALKGLRKSKKNALSNKRIKTLVTKLFKDSVTMTSAGKLDEAKETIKKFQQVVDKAAMINVISKNFASRKKSILAKALKKKMETK